MNVPLLVVVAVTSAADTPKLEPNNLPPGEYKRIQGSKLPLVSTLSPTRTTRASPLFAVNVHISRSPVEMVPVCITPLVIGPPPSPPAGPTDHAPLRRRHPTPPPPPAARAAPP